MASLFSGGGGWEVGALEAGFRPLWGVEKFAPAAQAHGANIPGDIYVGDVALLDPSTLEAPDVLCVSPPCQAWSEARRTFEELRCDADVGLSAIDFVEELRPSTVFLENVPKYAHSAVFEQIAAALHAQGYRVAHRTFPATYFGISQKRKRLLMVATRDGEAFSWPEARQPKGWYRDIEDLISGLPQAPPLAAWQLRGMDPCVPTTWPILVVGGNPTSCRIGGKTYRKTWYSKKQIGPTVVASSRNMSGTRIWEGVGAPLRFTPRCGARVMGFPDSYVLPADAILAWSVVGNAVPPPLSYALFSQIAQTKTREWPAGW